MWGHGQAMCVFPILPLPPPTTLSTPMSTARSGRSYLQCDEVEIADWGIIIGAIKERFTGRPESGVSTVSLPSSSTTTTNPPALHRAGSPTKSPKQKIKDQQGMRWLKHEGEGRVDSGLHLLPFLSLLVALRRKICRTWHILKCRNTYISGPQWLLSAVDSQPCQRNSSNLLSTPLLVFHKSK